MNMSRKDYIATAAALNAENHRSVGGSTKDEDLHRLGVAVAAQAMADYMESDNPRFDRHRFLKACGLSK